MTDSTPDFPSSEDFGVLLDETLGEQKRLDHKVVKGTVIAIENDFAIIDIGLKSEGRVPLREFGHGDGEDVTVGGTFDVYVDRIENAMGETILSRDKARREEAWEQIEKAYEADERVKGVIFGRVKGGFTVDLSGAVAFLPGSQVDIRPVRDITPLMGVPQPFQILKMDRRRGNIVVSRRAVLEEDRAEQRNEILQNLTEGQVVEGVVKNITEYGAFVDLGGIDGLLHVTDMSWRRINHPTEVLNVGDTVKVQIIRINQDTQRISLGMKQLGSDPWDDVEKKYTVGERLKGRVTNITDYGAFVELEEGVEGLIHVSEMSWTKKNVHPGKIVSTSQEVEVQVLEVDPEKRRISLGLKQCVQNPWEEFAEKYAPGTAVEGAVKNITEFGLFIGLDGDVDGMVHLSDINWQRSGDEALAEFKKGQMVKAVVLDVDVDKERISLGIKQLADDPFAVLGRKKKGDIVTGTVTATNDGGVEVTIGETGIKAFIRRSDLSRDRQEQRPDRYSKGDKVDAMITAIDRGSRRINLSIKALEISEEKAAVAQYGSTDSGASLGDILGAALKARDEERAAGEADEESANAKPSAKKAKADTSAKKPAGKAKAKKTAAADEDAKESEPETVAEEAEEPKKAKAAKKTTTKKATAKKTTTKKAAAKKTSTAAKKPAAKKSTAKAKKK